MDRQYKRLMDRLDLDLPGLEKVKAAAANPEKALEALLAYYRARTSVVHPTVERGKHQGAKFGSFSCSDKAIADDALRNVLVTTPAYPRHDFGGQINWLTYRAANGDMECVWQLNRHYSWNALSLAYESTKDERYASCYVRQLSDWITHCPPVAGSPAWRRIETGIRGHSWTEHFLRFMDSPAYTPTVLARQLNSLSEHAEWLTGNDMSVSNWGLMEAEGVAFVGMTFPEFKEAGVWRAKAFAHLNAMMSQQIRADGHQFEQCLGYHLGCIDWFARTAEMAMANNLPAAFPSEYWKGLERMCEVVLALGFPDGSHAQFGDDHSQFGWRDTIARWARFFDRSDILFAGTGGKEGKPPLATAFALKDSGFYSMRSAWDEQAVMLVLKCGPDGGYHCQPDNGTFEIYAGGRRMTPDSGSFIYGDNNKPDRYWFRRTCVHQTMTLNGSDTAFSPRLLAWNPGDNVDVLVVENTSGKQFIHRRAVFFVEKKYFVIVDEALGEIEGNVRLHFQLAPGHAIYDHAKFSVQTSFPKGMNLFIQAMPQRGLVLIEEEGQVSLGYNEKEPRPAFRFALTKSENPLRFVTVLVPFAGVNQPVIKVDVVDQPRPGSDDLRLDVDLNGVKSQIGYVIDKGNI